MPFFRAYIYVLAVFYLDKALSFSPLFTRSEIGHSCIKSKHVFK
jgi:hypothetical protein